MSTRFHLFFAPRTASLGRCQRPRWPHLAAAVLVAFALPSAAQPAGERAVVLNSGDGTVSVIDRATRTVVDTYAVGKEPHHLIATLDDRDLVVANAASNDLVFLDPSSGVVKRRLPRISDPYQLGYSPDGKWFVSISLLLDRVDIYAMPNYELTARIPVAKTPSHVAFSRDSTTAYVTMQESDEIVAIDLARHQLLWRMPVGKTPAGIWMSPQGLLFVGIMGADYVQIIDPAKRAIVRQIVTGRGAHNIVAVGDGRRVLVSNRVDGTITPVDYQSFTAATPIKVGRGVDCMEVSADGREVWATVRWEARVAVVDLTGTKPVAYIPVGRSPHGIYFKSHARRDR
ncbi:MAG: YncE family protein [Burkholderiales bacterium]|nr:YncE family protein [Burkholderiales bacterium]